MISTATESVQISAVEMKFILNLTIKTTFRIFPTSLQKLRITDEFKRDF